MKYRCGEKRLYEALLVFEGYNALQVVFSSCSSGNEKPSGPPVARPVLPWRTGKTETDSSVCDKSFTMGEFVQQCSDNSPEIEKEQADGT